MQEAQIYVDITKAGLPTITIEAPLLLKEEGHGSVKDKILGMFFRRVEGANNLVTIKATGTPGVWRVEPASLEFTLHSLYRAYNGNEEARGVIKGLIEKESEGNEPKEEVPAQPPAKKKVSK